MTWLKASLYACLALFLTGCFTSDDPLISRDGEDFPIAEGRYTALQLGDVEEDLFAWSGELSYRDGRIWSATPDAPLEHGVFRHLQDNFYAVMDASEEDSYLYLLIWSYPDGGVGLHLPSCGLLSAGPGRTRLRARRRQLPLHQLGTIARGDGIVHRRP